MFRKDGEVKKIITTVFQEKKTTKQNKHSQCFCWLLRP
jgi:hypothetical protein